MRPIDADALKEKIEQSDGEGTIARYCKRVLAECLDNDAPTIDAIPVEWIENMLKEWLKDSTSFKMCHAISTMLVRWQKEQKTVLRDIPKMYKFIPADTVQKNLGLSRRRANR